MITKKLFDIRFFYTIVAFSDLLFITYLSLEKFNLTIKPLKNSLNLLDIEILGHIFFYFSLSYFLNKSLASDFNLIKSKTLSIMFSLIYGIIIEIIQYLFLDYRSFEIVDILSNIFGIFIFMVIKK
ncbi:MAG: VanZ family protein [Bacteroidota bacterium]|nr:hypothetical protein [Flavobacteriaceae bacterium]MEC8615254.1 VanZ family protein [Bacteroidota bacterium]